MDMTADSSRVLLQEAQSEISALRAELYATRRTAWESQQALNQAVAQRDQLEAAREQLQRRVEAFESKAVRVEPLEQANRDLQDALEQLSSRLKQADSSLAEEQTARQHFQEVYSKAEAERARLQRARDELATRILVAEQRTKEAEEEQIRAEEDAAAFQQELHALQSRLGKPDSATPGGDAVDGNAPELLRQLEAERSRSASLLMALNTAKAAATSSNADLDFARERIQQLEQALHGMSALSHVGREQSSAANLSSIAGSVASQDGGQAPLSAAETAQIVQKLRSQVGSLKQSRDKLLAQVDAQQMDVERLSTENQALVDSLADLRAVQALCVELTRATGISGDLERFALPMLNGIEGRLTQLLRMKTVRQ
ncbi:hypothetical protein WJX72_010778 [[Myrmecia] bisecta]|uniref:Uncharacterized protein n=1 Tax=[Myrmecia] bisecta TaxID=41462 RepID=A0AAW1PQW7_9CHLO